MESSSNVNNEYVIVRTYHKNTRRGNQSPFYGTDIFASFDEALDSLKFDVDLITGNELNDGDFHFDFGDYTDEIMTREEADKLIETRM